MMIFAEFTKKMFDVVVALDLEAVDFQLILLHQSHLCQELADILSLVTLKLQDFSVLWMFNYSSVASEFLQKQCTSFRLSHVAKSNLEINIPPTFLQDRTIFLRS